MSIKILAIDDSRTIRNLLKLSIEGAGFEFHSACDGVEGVEAFPEVDPDVVITDINMPNMDGYGVIENLRNGENKTNVPILVLTTESGEELKARARDAGATGWIVKPFEETALISVLKRLTGHVS